MIHNLLKLGGGLAMTAHSGKSEAAHVGGIERELRRKRYCRTLIHFGREDLGWGYVIQEVFPGCPQMKKGYMYLNDAPGIGVDIDEKLA